MQYCLMAFDELEVFMRSLHGFRCDLDENEYQSMKEETVDQIKEFTEALDRMNKGDTTLTSTFSSMRQVSSGPTANTMMKIISIVSLFM